MSQSQMIDVPLAPRHFGDARLFGRKIDQEILAGFADPDEIRNEERICAHRSSVFIESSDVGDESVSAHPTECMCEDCLEIIGDEVVLKDCTAADFEAIQCDSKVKVNAHRVNRRGRIVEMFDMSLSLHDAERLGIV